MPQTALSAGRDRALDPARGPGDIVAGEEDAALGRRQPLLHEVAVHAVVVAVVARQGTLEGAEEVGVGFPGNGDRVADDVLLEVEAGIDLLQRSS